MTDSTSRLQEHKWIQAILEIMSKFMFVKMTEAKSPFDIALKTEGNDTLLEEKALAKVIEIKSL